MGYLTGGCNLFTTEEDSSEGDDMNQEYIKLCSIPAVQEKIREKMGASIDFDLLHSPIQGVGVVTETTDKAVRVKFNYHGLDAAWIDRRSTNHFLRLPQLHDLNDEKRGLIGMCRTEKYDRLVMNCKGERWAVGIYSSKGGPMKNFYGTTPELALLKALMHQWGLEVKG